MFDISRLPAGGRWAIHIGIVWAWVVCVHAVEVRFRLPERVPLVVMLMGIYVVPVLLVKSTLIDEGSKLLKALR